MLAQGLRQSTSTGNFLNMIRLLLMIVPLALTHSLEAVDPTPHEPPPVTGVQEPGALRQVTESAEGAKAAHPGTLEPLPEELDPLTAEGTARFYDETGDQALAQLARQKAEELQRPTRAGFQWAGVMTGCTLFLVAVQCLILLRQEKIFNRQADIAERQLSFETGSRKADLAEAARRLRQGVKRGRREDIRETCRELSLAKVKASGCLPTSLKADIEEVIALARSIHGGPENENTPALRLEVAARLVGIQERILSDDTEGQDT